MDENVIHISQGDAMLLSEDEIEYISNSFEAHNIGLGCIDFRQNIVIFPQGYVGYLSLPTRKIIIDSKHEGVDLRHILRIYYFMYTSDVMDIDDPIYDLENSTMFDVIPLFLSELNNVVKKGLPVEYRDQEDDLEFLRGNLNPSRTLYNMALRKREIFNCAFDTLSKDIAINQILYKAYKKVKNITDGDISYNYDGYFGDVSDIKEIPEISLNTNTQYCKKALALANIILNDLSISDYGNDGYGQNLMINFDRLFEDFVKKILVYYSGDFGFTYWNEDRPYAISTSTDAEYNRSYLPDLLYDFKDGREPIAACILDMKNKTKAPFTNADVYQMFFYANQLKSKKVVLCYPSVVNQDNAHLKFNNEKLFLKRIDAVYINIAGETSKDFKNNINEFISKVKQLVS